MTCAGAIKYIVDSGSARADSMLGCPCSSFSYFFSKWDGIILRIKSLIYSCTIIGVIISNCIMACISIFCSTLTGKLKQVPMPVLCFPESYVSIKIS